MMDMAQVFSVNKGLDEGSYARNSEVQKKMLSIAKAFVEEALLDYLSTPCPPAMGIADLGCGTGANALTAVSEIGDVVYEICEKSEYTFPELMIYLNDLPRNDFNSIFTALPSFYQRRKTINKDIQGGASGDGKVFIVGCPGSFYGRLFPSKSLHFVHSSSSLHWLSQVPTGLDTRSSRALNKGKIYLSKTSSNAIHLAYLSQFKYDFTLFLESRSCEVIPGGRMILSFMGRNSKDATVDEACLQWELFARTLMSMVSEGIIEEVDSFNVAYYAASREELLEVIEKQGSFAVHRLETVEIDWDIIPQDAFSVSTKGERIAKSHRAVMESTLENLFGSEIIDNFFRRYAKFVDDHLSTKNAKYLFIAVSVIRK